MGIKALIYFKSINLKLSSNNSPQKLIPSETDADICTKSGDNLKCTFGTDTSSIDLNFSVKQNSYYQMESVQYNGDSYFPIKNTYKVDTAVPKAPLNQAYTCFANTFETKINTEDQNQLEFVDFTVQINSQNDENGVAPKEFTDLNKCVGFFSAETVLCISSLLIMFLISAFSAWMIGGITTMDKFEDPSVRSLHVPLDAK